MAVMTFSNALLALPEVTSVKSAVEQRPSFFARFMNALVESRFRAAEREIARHRAMMGGPVLSLKVDAKDLPFSHE